MRLFIAIPLSDKIREEIQNLVTDFKKVRGFPKGIRFIPSENWHFTLTFLGYQNESVIPVVKKTLTNLTRLNLVNRVKVDFEEAIYGPVQKTPRMIWLTTTPRTSANIEGLKNLLEDALSENGVKWNRETRPYLGHLTLARFEPTARKLLPKIERSLNWSYEPTSLDLMRSTLLRSGAVYDKIFSVDFPK